MITKNWTPKFIALVVVCFLVGAAMGLVGYHYFLKPEVVMPEFSPPPRIVTPLTWSYDFPPHPFGPLVEPLYEPIGDIKYLKVEFAFPGTVFEIGEKEVISPQLINTGDRAVTISHGDPLFWVVLEDKERGLKWIPARVYKDILVLHELEPGESYYYNEERIILIEDSPILEETPRYTLEPGIYTLHVYAEFKSTIDGDEKAFRIYAPSIQIEIRR
ncbi:hypothetical protein M1M86_01530 [Dehalococcoidales bacterium]|nr:hypothetical protein [Dehalococcoidales bacterium]